jgi:hypothetical protein
MDFRDKENQLTMSEIIKSGVKWYRRVEFYHEPSNTIIQGEVVNEIDQDNREDDCIGFLMSSIASTNVHNDSWLDDFRDTLIDMHCPILNHANVQGE